VKRRRAVALALAALATCLPVGSASASEQGDPAQELVERYAPVVVVREQREPCGDGEAFTPMPVDPLFGDDRIVVRGPDGTVITGPTADDLAALPAAGAGWHIDVPGNALRPGCDYERLFRSMDAPVTTYARIATDADHPDELVIQYWFFYLYNDWNDRHEGDWEMIQVHLAASDVTGALTAEPVRVAVAQHEGSEVAPWGDDRLEVRDGTHPVVYVGDGSHATYLSSAQWFGKSAASGFGCDDTTAPSRELDPQVVLLDDDALPTWLAFEGRWGERRPSFNNGPTGPTTKTQWNHPVQWVNDEGRAGSVSLPADGSDVTDFFCAATAAVSKVMFRALDSPLTVTLFVLAVVVLFAVAARRTTWRPAEIAPIAQRRRAGQVLFASARLVRRRWRAFAAIGAVMPLTGVLAALTQAALDAVTPFEVASDVAGSDSVWGGLFASMIGLVFLVPAAGVVGAATILYVRSLDDDQPLTASAAVRQVRHHVPTVLLGVALVFGLASLYLTVVLVPLALVLHARWAVAVPASLDASHPFRRSAALTSGRRVRSVALGLTTSLLTSVLPVFIGTAVLLVSNASFDFVNVIASGVALVVVPLAAVVTALQHLDLEVRHRALAEPAT
jgi:hypothetical protein